MLTTSYVSQYIWNQLASDLKSVKFSGSKQYELSWLSSEISHVTDPISNDRTPRRCGKIKKISNSHSVITHWARYCLIRLHWIARFYSHGGIVQEKAYSWNVKHSVSWSLFIFSCLFSTDAHKNEKTLINTYIKL